MNKKIIAGIFLFIIILFLTILILIHIDFKEKNPSTVVVKCTDGLGSDNLNKCVQLYPGRY